MMLPSASSRLCYFWRMVLWIIPSLRYHWAQLVCEWACTVFYSCFKFPAQTGLERERERERERETDIDNRERCMAVLVVQHEGESHKRSLILRFVRQAPIVVTPIMCSAICRISPLKYWARPWNKPSHSAFFVSQWSAVSNDAVIY
jgi:hypothetical protein